MDAARDIFAAKGYDQATIRAVAAQANIHASMVMRYFGSKAGLFAAVATVRLQALDLGAVPAPERGKAIVRHFVSRWEDPSEDVLVLLRTAVTNDAVASQLQAVFEQEIAGPIAALGGDHAARRSAAIGTQLLGLALCRYILHFEPLASLSADEVVSDIGLAVQHYLDQPLS